MAPPEQGPGLSSAARRENDATWARLRDGMTRIMTRLTEGIDMKTYMSLYTSVHNFCTSQKGQSHSLHHGGQNSPQRGAHLLGEDLYNNLLRYLQLHCEEVCSKAPSGSDEQLLLSYYIKEWNRYTLAAGFINHLFKYLNRHWVKREIDEGKKQIYDIYTLHLVQWRDVMFQKTQSDVMGAVIRLVRRQRNGETIEHSQIKSIVESFVSLGIDESEHNKGTLEVYKTYFEEPFLDETKRYYESESRQFLAENNVVEYMKKAEKRLHEEKEHVPLYLLTEITQPLMKVCNTALISDHAELFQDEFLHLLTNDRRDDLGRMYSLLNRIAGGLNPLRTRFEKHVIESGRAAVAKVVSGNEQAMEPKAYMEALLSVHTHYSDLVTRAFGGETDFVRSLDNACREYVNHNIICDKQTTRSPELLAKHADNLLKKNAQTVEEDDLETSLNDIMTIFRFIDDKDVFQTFYSRNLAKRLVQTSSASDDAETNMISKLKEACGFEYTNKLQRMFQDIQTSKDLNRTFKDEIHQDTKNGVDATYQILGAGFWPLTAPNTPFTPPQTIVKTYERFEGFYASKHSGRKLTWLWQLCKGEMRANYVKQGKVPYTLLVSTYQMAILMLFNDAKDDTVSYDEMAATTSLARETLDPSISIFLKAKLLLAEPEGAKPESGTRYRLNHGFKNKKPKVNLNINIKAETKQEAEDTHKTIEEDRKLLIQSAIVRIMKSRKKLRHQLLVQETISQISQRFKPSVQDIKKCVDILLEREYLERLEDGELGYLA